MMDSAIMAAITTRTQLLLLLVLTVVVLSKTTTGLTLQAGAAPAGSRTGKIAAAAFVVPPHHGCGGAGWQTKRTIIARRKTSTTAEMIKTPAASSSGSTALHFLTGETTDGVSTEDQRPRRPVDFIAIVKYAVALAVQMALIGGFLSGIDAVVARYSIKQVPAYVNFLFLYLFNLKTSVFSILPQAQKKKTSKQKDRDFQSRTRPSWTPPGWAFVVGWPLFVFGTRAATAAVIVSRSGGVYATSAVMALMFHLCIANLWNTVNNVERRLGTSVVILYGLWISKAYAAWQFFRVDQLVGEVLALTLTWLSAAAALETRTWQINPDPDTGKLEPLYPAKDDKWKTKFRWE